MNVRRFTLISAITALAASILVFGSVLASSTVIVTPTNQQGWSTADTRPGGTVDFVVDSSAPGGSGALQLTTDATNAAKAQYIHATNTPLANVTELSYYTKQVSASFAQGDPSYQVVACLNGVDGGGNCLGFTTLVFEPYENTTQGAVVPGIWQSWDVDAGLLWSSKTVACSGGGVLAGAGGPPFYTLSGISAQCPSAVVVGFGVNVGSFNPSYVVESDLVDFNGTIYDFEKFSAPSNKDQCKDGGWLTFNPSRTAGPFKNQGDCIQYANTGK
jgi:hypothetical protein